MKYTKRVFFLVVFIFLILVVYLYRSINDTVVSRIGNSDRNIDSIEQSIQNFNSKLGQIHGKVEKFQENLNSFDGNFHHVIVPKQNPIDGNDVDVQIHEQVKLRNIPENNYDVKEINCHGVAIKSDEGPQLATQMIDIYEQLTFDNTDGGVWKQGWPITYEESDFTDDNPLKVYVVPHSHNDPGWIKTFEEYYRAQTVNILDNIVHFLSENRDRRFIWAEISFLDKWWSEQKEEKREKFRKLVLNGQLEITTAGWVMTDEANSHYTSMIDELLEGHLWMRENVGKGYIPRTSWSIDPFGLSPTMSYILNRAKIPNLAIQRVHYSVKKYLAQQKHLEFPWRQPWALLDDSTDTFTHLFPFYSYDIPHTCGPDPRICCQFDFKRFPHLNVACPWGIGAEMITDNNILSKSQVLLDQYKKHATLYSTNVLLIILGDDFRYDNVDECHKQFENYERLFVYMNSKPKMNVRIQWGTLHEYFTELTKEKSRLKSIQKVPVDFQSLTGDFFTYSDRGNHYWSGYYTSRPFYKEMDRELRHYLRTAEIFFSIANFVKKSSNSQFSTLWNGIVNARRNAALFQHHDGVTGTAKNHVVNDYGIKMLDSLKSCTRAIIHSIRTILTNESPNLNKNKNNNNNDDDDKLWFDMDDYRIQQDSLPERISIILNQNPRDIIFVNSLARARNELINIRVTTPYIEIKSPNKKTVLAQACPVLMPDGSSLHDAYDIYFEINIPPLGYAKYTIIPTIREKSQVIYSTVSTRNYHFPKSDYFDITPLEDKDIIFNNDFMTAIFDSNKGVLKKVTKSLIETEVRVEFLQYGTNVNNKEDRSGAYLFFPDGEATRISDMDRPQIIVINGGLISRICAKFNLLTHCSTFAKTRTMDAHTLLWTNYINLQQNANDKEIVMRLTTSVATQDTASYFYTDLNGFMMQRRKYYSKLTTQGNFYPMPTLAYIQNKRTRLSVHTKQSLGVGSLSTGSLEIMLDRRLTGDDNRGLGQGVTDNKATVEIFRLLIEHTTDQFNDPIASLSHPSMFSHFVRDMLQNPIMKLITLPAFNTIPVPSSAIYSSLRKPLPCDVHLVNFRTISRKTPATTVLILHRYLYDCDLLHIPVDKNFCQMYDTKNGLELTQLFSHLNISEIKPMSLTLMYDAEMSSGKASVAMLEPMDIKSFMIALFKFPDYN